MSRRRARGDVTTRNPRKGAHTHLELVITVEGGPDTRLQLYGPSDANLRIIREAFGIRILARDATLKLIGDSDSVGKAAAVIETLRTRLHDKGRLHPDDVADALHELAVAEQEDKIGRIQVYRRSADIKPRTDGQEAYVRAIQESDLTFCLGPAGTGKTYLAVAVAASLLKAGHLKRIVLARPAVEAGEKLGYLPGDLQAKVNPYLRPLFDAMGDMMEFDQVNRFIKNDIIEVVPLAFMRGRTLNNAGIILDEAQNATRQQMLMFLTRLGHHSKMIVTGDDSQSDLATGAESGLIDAVKRLSNIEGIGIVRLTQQDIVRHRLVTRIVHAYDLRPSAPRPE